MKRITKNSIPDDYIGQRRGSLMIISLEESYEPPAHYKWDEDLTPEQQHISKLSCSKFRCKCNCENEVVIPLGEIINGQKQSCGSCNAIDFTGKRFGLLEAVKRVDDLVHYENGYRTPQWLCKCDCGNEIVIPLNPPLDKTLGFDNSSCGCLSNKDLSGMTFGMIKIIKFVGYRKSEFEPNIYHKAYFCKCECGKEFYRNQNDLLSRSFSGFSCGCSQRVYEDLTDRQSGLLTVIKRVQDKVVNGKGVGANIAQWLCKCECGNERIVAGGSIRNGSAKSCGCLTLSSLEYWMREQLSDYGYSYKQQVKFDDLLGLGGKQMSYDFGIYDDEKLICLIECQGRQHYEAVDYFGGEKQFEKQQLHDELKREYAFENLHVPLIEIPYDVSENVIKKMLLQGGLIWEFVDCYNNKI